jgi:hypothetical protein
MLRILITTAALGVSGLGLAPAATAVPLSPTVIGSDAPLSPASQRNVVRKAQSYLEYSAFSQRGLMEQLMYEGFSQADAAYAVNAVDVDWDVQAAKKAQSYLEYSSFSQQSLYDQLMYEGFTSSQAAFGVSAAYR